MRPHRSFRLWGLLIAGLLGGCVVGSAAAQGYPGFVAPRRPRGTYGRGMSFGEFGYRMNYGYAFGPPYGGLGTTNYGFGYGFGPGFPPGGATLYGSAYVSPGTNSSFSGYYPPFASYGTAYQNPAVFPSPAPNHGGYRPAAPRPMAGFVPVPR